MCMGKALCGVSTGVYGYPVEQACPVVLKTVRKWLLENENYLMVFQFYLD